MNFTEAMKAFREGKIIIRDSTMEYIQFKPDPWTPGPGERHATFTIEDIEATDWRIAGEEKEDWCLYPTGSWDDNGDYSFRENDIREMCDLIIEDIKKDRCWKYTAKIIKKRSGLYEDG